jgi:tetratricopeptide (TPR) repeat protein
MRIDRFIFFLITISGSVNILRAQDLRKEYYNCAIEKFDAKDYKASIEYYTRVIAIYPKDTMAYFDRAMAKEMINDYQGAIDDYTRQLKIDNKNVDCYFLRGVMKFKLEDFKGAIDDCNKTLKIESDNSDAAYYKAMSEKSLGNLKAALNDLTLAISLNGTNPLYYLKRTELYMQSGKKLRACEDYHKYKQLGGEEKLSISCN